VPLGGALGKESWCFLSTGGFGPLRAQTGSGGGKETQPTKKKQDSNEQKKK